MAPGQAPTVVSSLKIFGEGLRVRAMLENAASILKQRRLVTLLGTIDFHIQQWIRYITSTWTSSKDSCKVSVWLATGIREVYNLGKFEMVCYSQHIVSAACLSTFMNRKIYQLLPMQMRRKCIRF